VRSFVLPCQTWHRPLPRRIVIPKVMTLSTLEDVRASASAFAGRYREKQTWQRMATLTTAAARGQLVPEEVSVAVRMVLQLEGIRCQQ
jgi:hypothetical protein